MKKLIPILMSVLLTACGPIGPMPGGKLAGKIDSAPMTWQALGEVDIVQLETNAGLPQSFNIWAVTVDNQIYVTAAGGINTSWVKNVLKNPRVLLKIEDKIYGLNAVRLKDADEQAAAGKRYGEKYDLSQIDQAVEDLWMFRLNRT